MREIGRNSGGLVQYIGDIAKSIGLEANLNIERGEEPPWGFWLSDTLIFQNVIMILISFL